MTPSPARPVQLEDYGLIGNLHTAALVSRWGSIDWACFPRFASPSVFARLLDIERGGYLSTRPEEPFRSRQRYRRSSCVLETVFELSGGRSLVITDLMPVIPDLRPEGAPMVLRALAAYGGPVPVAVEFAPRFDYARALPTWSPGRGGVAATANGARLSLELPWSLTRDGPTATGRGVVPVGEPVPLELTWGDHRPTRETFPELVEGTDRFWQRWTHQPSAAFHRLGSPFHSWVERSELTLKLLSHADTGAFVAAPTTSVPEWPGGSRNWDYRYVWIRDAAFTGDALFLLGHEKEAISFLRWALLRLREDPVHRLRVVYGAHGERDLSERTLPHLSGLWDSRPVRVGNGAAEQFQLDIYGELLDAALVIDRVDPEFLQGHWAEVAELAEEVARRWRQKDRGIWEVRGPPQHYVHSKLMAWVALDRAARLGVKLDHPRRHRRWAAEADTVRSWLLTEGFDPERGAFRQAAGSPDCDAANLRIPLVGFLPFDDDRVRGTVERVGRELSRGAFVYRYRAPDGITGEEGAFLAASFWRVECLARGGREEEALGAWRELLGAATPLGLFCEEHDPVGNRRLGNFPQALTHIALLRAAAALGERLPARAGG